MSSSRLQEIRDQKMYPFFDQGTITRSHHFGFNISLLPYVLFLCVFQFRVNLPNDFDLETPFIGQGGNDGHGDFQRNVRLVSLSPNEISYVPNTNTQ